MIDESGYRSDLIGPFHCSYLDSWNRVNMGVIDTNESWPNVRALAQLKIAQQAY